jgi:hypothetical protein
MVPRWFIYLNGFAMLILGVALIATRPRKAGDSLYKKYINLGTFWACLCCTVGGALLAMALGYWTWPPRPSAPAEQHPSWRRPR